MLSFFRFLPILGAVIGLGSCLTLSSDESDVDLVTSRAVVIVEHSGKWLNCSGTLISSNIVYTIADCVTDLEGNIDKNSLRVTLMIDEMRTRRVEKVFHPPGYLENWNTTLMCDREDYKCAEECLHNLDKDSEGDLVQNYALLLLEEPFPLCEKEGDAVAAALDTSPLTKDQEKMIENPKEECFIIGDEKGVGILRSVRQFVNETKPECESKMMEFITVDKSEYIDSSNYEYKNDNIHCTTNDGKAVQVRFLEILSTDSIDCPPTGLQTARHASELVAVISAWGEYENYKRSQRKCSTFLEKYPYDSVKEKYLKGSA